MTDITPSTVLAQPSGRRRAIFSIIGWLTFLLVAGIAWYFLLTILAPARVNFGGERGSVMGAFIPPVLLTVLCWAGMRRPGAPGRPSLASSALENPASLVEYPPPKVRYRIGAWSVQTPQGNAVETAARTKARAKAFKPDKAILLAGGNPAHAAIVDKLRLEQLGYPATTRLRAPRVAALLTGVLDDLHARQISLPELIDGPASVYWIVPQAFLTEDKFHADIFASVWKHSSWRKLEYLLHVVPDAPAAGYAILAALQNGIDDSVIPYTLVVAADSLLDSDELATALALEQVFSDTAPLGFIPSEGAGGLLLFNPEKSPHDMWANAMTLAPVTMTRLPAEKTARGTADGLSQAISSSISAAATSAADVMKVVSNTDHRVQGSLLVIGALAQLMAHLDPLEDRLSPMEYAGAFGVATDVVHLALAMEMAAADSHIVCAVCNADSRFASVLVLPA